MLYDEDLAMSLVQHDPAAPQGLIEANVRTAALHALRAMNSKQLPAAATAALTDPDDQLVYTAAILLKDSGREDAMQPLADALTRLSKRTTPVPRTGGRQMTAPTMSQMATLASARDSSRDARVAILTALAQLSQPGDGLSGALRYLLADTDPAVASAAAGIIGRLTGTLVYPKPTKLAPIQPAESDIVNTQPRCARIMLDNGKRVDLTMAMADAPVAAARFLMLAADRFYDGLTFHRVEVNSFVQAGSPDANELSNGDRFIRDEISLPITGVTDVHGQSLPNGVVALVTRGRDTGAGQFIMPLMNLPGLNHEFTVFATFNTFTKTTPGWIDLLQDAQIVEGTKISSIREVPCPAK